jgi:hypothetical protein
MPDVGTAYLQIVPSMDGVPGSIRRGLGGEADAAGVMAGGRISGKIKGALAASGIGAALGAGLAKSIKTGANLEQAIGGIETLFKDSADEMIKNADNAFKTAGISANQYMEQATSFAASLLQSLDGDTQKAAKAADQAVIDMSDNANKMGTNIQDIQNAYQGFAKQNYTMLDNLKLGYGGTKTEMERLLADAEKISGQKYDINNLSDVYEAIHVIQEEMDITGTTSKEAASTLSGSFSSMKAAAENFLGDLALGRNVGPAMVDLAESAGTFLFDNLLPAIGRVFASLPQAISALIQTGLPSFMASGSEMVTGLVSGIQTAAPQLAKKIPELVQQGMDAISQNLPNIMAKGRDMIVGLVQGITSNLPAFIDAVSNIASKIPDFLKQNQPKIAAEGGKLIGQLAAGLIKNLPKIIVAVAKLGLTIISTILKNIPVMPKTGKTLVFNFAKGLGGAALAAVKSAAKKIVTGLISPISTIGGKIKGYVDKVKSLMSFSGLASKVRGIWNSVKSAITGPIESAKNTVSRITKKIKGFFPLGGGKLFTGIKLPHFTVKGGKFPFGVAGKGSLPKWNVSWYRKAEDTPYLFTKPTAFETRVAGEHNDEIMYGRRNLMNDISEAVKDKGQAVVQNFYITVNGAQDPEEYMKGLMRRAKMEARAV